MKFVSSIVAIALTAVSGAAFAGGGCWGGGGGGNCEVVGFASNNGYAPVTTGTYSGSNYAYWPSVAAPQLSFATHNFGTFTATAGGSATLAMQDLSAANGGLGATVIKNGKADTSSETISGGDQLTLSFTSAVQIDALEFDDANYSQTCFLLFCSYNPGGDALTSSTKFLLSIDGGPAQKLSLGNGSINNLIIPSTNLIGKTFTFSVDPASGSTPFYIGAIEVCKAVPEPSTYAILGLGLAGLAWSSRRRTR